MENLILLVDDDEELGQTLKDFFEDNGLSVVWAKEGRTVIRQFKEFNPHLVLLDIVLPGKDGFEIAEEIRSLNRVIPILFMTGTALDKENYIKAYNVLGAINYIEKPINPHNALAQIQSLLHPVSRVKEYNINNYHIIIDGQLLIIDNKDFQFRDKEIQVVSILLDNVNLTVNRNDIMHKVWNKNEIQINSMLDIAISHIKKELKDFPAVKIRTIYGVGYKLSIK